MKPILSIALAAAMLLTGCAGTVEPSLDGPQAALDGAQSAPGYVNPSIYSLANPVYPEFPQKPQWPEKDGEGVWEAYWEAFETYNDALSAIRGSGLTEAERGAVNGFAAKSLPLVVTGHEGENAVYSPLSLWSALAMLAQCAGGDSRQQVLDALGTDSVDHLQEVVSHLWQALYTDDGLSSLILGNSIWLNSNLQGTYVQETLDTLAQKYFAGTYSVPMGTGIADDAVTNWVSQQTNGLIGGDAPVVETLPETLALLVSSLYYRCAWLDEFSTDRTEEDIFIDSAGNDSRVSFMHKSENANFLRLEGCQAAALSTQLGEMVFVLPDGGVAPESLLRDPDFLSRLDFTGDAAIWGEVQWSMPKFDVDSGLGLMPALKSLGVTDLQDPDLADLSPLTDLDAFLSDAKQLARVKVDEEGVEAAAVTIMDMVTTSMPLPPDEVCVMDLNRPFLFVIRTEGIPLFVGIVNQVK